MHHNCIQIQRSQLVFTNKTSITIHLYSKLHNIFFLLKLLLLHIKIKIIYLAWLGAKATATESTAITTGKSFGLANRGTILIAHTWSLETMAQRLTMSCLYDSRWSHFCENKIILVTYELL